MLRFLYFPLDCVRKGKRRCKDKNGNLSENAKSIESFEVKIHSKSIDTLYNDLMKNPIYTKRLWAALKEKQLGGGSDKSTHPQNPIESTTFASILTTHLPQYRCIGDKTLYQAACL